MSHASTSGDPSMLGFIDNYRRNHDGMYIDHPLRMWKPEKVPIITTLAKEFALFDRFFPAHAGPTDPNRMFMHTGSSRGVTETGECRDANKCCPQKSIYRLLEENDIDWKLYYEDNPLGWFLFVKDLNETYVTPG